MQVLISGADFGIFVLGRTILKQYPKAKIKFFFKKISKEKESIKESDFRERGIKEILSEITRFGRIGVFLDRKNLEAKTFFQKQIVESDQTKYLNDYNPKDTRRAEKKPNITLFDTQLLRDFANEGLADSVEFRRLTRKFIRNAKNAGCDTIFFPEAIFGEKKTQQILQQIAGTQMKVVTLKDFFPIPKIDSTKREIKICWQEESKEFLKKRAEKILETKLGKEVLGN